jgi:hypothetical protein
MGHILRWNRLQNTLLKERWKKGKMSHRCHRTTAIQERVTAVLRSIPKEVFADSFQKLYERCQPCVVRNGNYFEGQ